MTLSTMSWWFRRWRTCRQRQYQPGSGLLIRAGAKDPKHGGHTEPITWPPAKPPPVPVDLDDGTAAGIATDLWRAIRKVNVVAGEGSQSYRQLARHLESLRGRLKTIGVEYQDHDGLAFDLGLALDVLAWETRPQAEREVVVETVTPSVYRGGRTIQVGQVIVARPEDGEDHGSPDH